jgi:hypothetical protein
VNPVAVEEAVGDSPAWTQWQSGRWSVRTRWLWRRSRSGGHVDGSEMKNDNSARV